jgi:hypothetical protein
LGALINNDQGMKQAGGASKTCAARFVLSGITQGSYSLRQHGTFFFCRLFSPCGAKIIYKAENP